MSGQQRPDPPVHHAALPGAREALRCLTARGASHVIGVPDNGTAPLFAAAAADPAVTSLVVSREGEAFAIAAGLWIGGAQPVVVIQNTGLLESGDALRGTVTRMGVPLVCIIGYRGAASLARAGAGEAAEPAAEPELLRRADVDSAAVMTLPTLRAWGVPTEHLRGADLAALDRAWDRATAEQRPVAVLLHTRFG